MCVFILTNGKTFNICNDKFDAIHTNLNNVHGLSFMANRMSCWMFLNKEYTILNVGSISLNS